MSNGLVYRGWRRARKGWPIAALGLVHVMILCAGFFAPYRFEEQNRQLAYAPPSHIHFFDSQHKFHARPFVYPWLPVENSWNEYREDRTRRFPIRLLVTGAPYQLLGRITADRHLFGTDDGGTILLLGSDAYGRDEFSRLLFGGRISLFAGVLAALISVLLGTALGGLAGYYGRWIDDGLMRACEVFLSVPWLYLLLTVRAVLPLHLAPGAVFLLLSLTLGVIGWARPARLIRGVVLSVKQRDYVAAARGFGASDLYILRIHILPFAAGVAATQLALYIPQYVLAEVTLSFFGLGVSEPAASWGNMLAGLQQSFVLASCWWMFAPAAALMGILVTYHWLFSRYESVSQSKRPR